MELFSNYSYYNLSDNMTSHLTSTPRESQVIRHRNLSLGLIGICLNLAGVILLALSRDIRTTLKIPLISLSINDVMFVAVVFFRGTLRDSPVTTNHPACWPSMYLCYTSIMISYLTIGQLSFQNYIVVFVPLQCHEIITNVKVVITIASIWMTGFLVVLGCFGMTLQVNQPCISLIPISSPGIGVFAGTCTLCACVVTVLNLMIFIKIRKLNRTVNVVLQDNGSASNRTKTEMTSTGQTVLRSKSRSARHKTEIREESSAHASNLVDYLRNETKSPNSVWVSPSTSNIVSQPFVPQSHIVSHLRVPQSHSVPHLGVPQPHSVPHLEVPQSHIVPHLEVPQSHSFPHLEVPQSHSVPHLEVPQSHSVPHLEVPQSHSVPHLEVPQSHSVPHLEVPQSHSVSHLEVPQNLDVWSRSRLNTFFKGKQLHSRSKHVDYHCFQKRQKSDVAKHFCSPRADRVQVCLDEQNVDKKTHAFFFMPASMCKLYEREKEGQLSRDKGKHRSKNNMIMSISAKLSKNNRKIITIDSRHVIASDTRHDMDNDTRHDMDNDTRHDMDNDTRHAIDNDTRHAINNATRHAIDGDTLPTIDIDTQNTIYSDTRHRIDNVTRHNVIDTQNTIDSDTRHAAAIDTRHAIDHVFHRVNEEKTLRRHGTARVRNTLLIVTFWCCLLTLPFLISLVILMANPAFEKVTFAQSNMGIFLSSLVTCSALTNPLLYAWRFVQWRKIVVNFRKFTYTKCHCKKWM